MGDRAPQYSWKALQYSYLEHQLGNLEIL
jgi:hypothetical protein